MKTRKVIGAALAIIGLAAAVSVVDGSRNEMTIRAIGSIVFFIGALIGRFFDFQKDKA